MLHTEVKYAPIAAPSLSIIVEFLSGCEILLQFETHHRLICYILLLWLDKRQKAHILLCFGKDSDAREHRPLVEVIGEGRSGQGLSGEQQFIVLVSEEYSHGLTPFDRKQQRSQTVFISDIERAALFEHEIGR